ncbi:MAG: CFI-box-CTERM domain-containing protein [Candidatus Eremiobacteraeota bacterium]|nr:CFI-box-CTERM domain-containing protein [Candidatus Eremiobacteraeota bacterium]
MPMNRTRNALLLAIVLLAALAFLAPPVRAGSGIATADSSGKSTVLNLTVYFEDTAADQAAWKDNFTKSHAKLWQATKGRLRFGTIRMGTASTIKERADIIIGNDGHAHVTQPDTRKNTSLGTPDTMMVYYRDRNDPSVTLHELGHYLFTLSDEYLSEIRGIVNGVETSIDDEDEEEAYCCVQEADPATSTVNPHHSCIMYTHEYPDIYYMFCAAEHLTEITITDFADLPVTPTKAWAITAQQSDHQKSCSAVIDEFFTFFGLPVDSTQDGSGTPPSFTFEDLKPEARVSLMIQDSLSAADLTKAKSFAVDAVRNLRLQSTGRDGDSVGVSTFDSAVHDLYGWVDLKTQAEVDAAVEKIEGITATTDAANLESALDQEITSIVGSGHPFSLKAIMLYTNGPGTVSDTLINKLRVNDVAVNVIALSDSNRENMEKLCEKTGGKYTYKGTAAAKSWLTRLLGRADDDTEESGGTMALDALGGYLITRFSGTLNPGSPISHSLPVDTLNSEVIINFSSAGGPLTLGLKDPSGNVISLSSPPSGCLVQQTDDQVQVRIEKPASGTWTATVDGTDKDAYILELGGQGAGMGESEIEAVTATFPQATLVGVRVGDGETITGCQVQAVVTHPNGTKVTITLYDDGNRIYHGDVKANDGIYCTYFTQYSGSGSYQVEFLLNNQTGQYTTTAINADLEAGDTPPGPTGPAPVFQRILFDSFEVKNVPAGGGTALIAPGSLKLKSATAGQVTLTWLDTNNGSAKTVIQKSVNSANNYVDIATVDAGQTQYTDTAAGKSGTLSYRVLAGNTYGNSLPGTHHYMDAAMAATALEASSYSTGYTAFGDSGAGSGGCFIATAAYGSYLDPHVGIMRKFRDGTLAKFAPGRQFIRFYYRTSPPVANYLAQHSWARVPVRLALTAVVLTLEHTLITAFFAVIAFIVVFILVRRRRLSPVKQNK